MTTQRAIEILNQMLLECKESDKRVALALATANLEVKNEPAPAEADTSSGTQNKFLQVHDNTDLQKCQEVIKEARKRLLSIYEILSDEGRIAFELGELYHLLDRSEDGDEDA